VLCIYLGYLLLYLLNLYAITIQPDKGKTNEEIIQAIAKIYIDDFLKMLRTIQAINYYAKLAYFNERYPNRACTHLHSIVETTLAIEEVKFKLAKRNLNYYVIEVWNVVHWLRYINEQNKPNLDITLNEKIYKSYAARERFNIDISM
jgi:hypothetical protein